MLNFILFLIATSFLSWTLQFLSEISLQSFQSHWASAVSQDLIITCKGCQLVSLLLRLQHQLIITHSTDQSIRYSAITKHQVLFQIWKSSMSITRHRKAKVCLQFNEMGTILKTYNKVLWGYTKWSLSLLGKQLSWKTIQRWWVTSVESWRVSMRNSKEEREFQEKVLVYSRGAKQRKCIAVGSVRLQQWCLRMYWMKL